MVSFNQLQLVGRIEFVLWKLTNFKAEFAGFQVGGKLVHTLGEYIESRSNGNYKDMIEVVSTTMLHDAPLHGATWSAIRRHFEGRNWDTIDITVQEFQDYANELCYYRDYPDIYTVWISCMCEYF